MRAQPRALLPKREGKSRLRNVEVLPLSPTSRKDALKNEALCLLPSAASNQQLFKPARSDGNGRGAGGCSGLAPRIPLLAAGARAPGAPSPWLWLTGPFPSCVFPSISSQVQRNPGVMVDESGRGPVSRRGILCSSRSCDSAPPPRWGGGAPPSNAAAAGRSNPPVWPSDARNVVSVTKNPELSI